MKLIKYDSWTGWETDRCENSEVEWTPELQKLADRDESIKVDLCTCPSCGEGDAIYDSWDNKNKFCGNCGQRLNWGE